MQVAGFAMAVDINQKTSLSCRVSYALTDGLGNLLVCLLNSYIFYYYTDVFGLSLAIAGGLLFFTRFLDAIDVPIWGSIVDHTHSKYGRSRPFFLWLAIPFALSYWLTFTCPPFLSDSAKVVYAIVTYLIAGIVYSGIQTAITSILPNLTQNHGERMILTTFRMVGGSIGAFISMTFTLPLVNLLGQGDQKLGFSLTVGIFSVIVAVLMIYAFRHLREVNVEKIESIPVKDSLRAVKQNWPWILLVTANIFVWICISVRQTTVIYYAKYVLNDEDLIAILNGVLNLTCLSSFFLISFITGITRKFGAMVLGVILLVIGHLGMYMVGTNVALMITFWVVSSFGQGLICAMPFGMLADTVDYGEWKNGVRASGFLTAIGSALCIKLGGGFGAAIPAVIMGYYGYVANQEQTAEGLMGIQITFLGLPIILAILVAIPMLIYSRYERMESSIVADLQRRNVDQIVEQSKA